MKKFFKKDFFKFLFASLFIIAGVYLLNFVSAGNLLASVINIFTAPVQGLTNSVSSLVTDSLKKKQTEQDYKNQIDNLKSQIRKLRTITADYYDVKRENAQYLKFYGIKKADKSLEFTVATINSKNSSDFSEGFTLNKGALNKISKNAPVMTESGIVGRVEEVSANTCKVATILSPSFKASVVDSNSGDGGILSGNAKLIKENLSGMFYLSAQNNVKPDDVVVTSGLGGVYPKNMPIGKIKELKQDDFDSSFYATVEPFSDIKNITEVFVITNFAGKER